MKNQLNDFDESVQSAINNIELGPDMSEWAKIEQRMKTPPPKSSPNKWWVAGTAAVLVAAGALIWTPSKKIPIQQTAASTPGTFIQETDGPNQLIAEKKLVKSNITPVVPSKNVPSKLEGDNIEEENVERSSSALSQQSLIEQDEEGNQTQPNSIEANTELPILPEGQEDPSTTVMGKKSPESNVTLIIDQEVCEHGTLNFELSELEAAGYSVMSTDGVVSGTTMGTIKFSEAGYTFVRLFNAQMECVDSVQVEIHAKPNIVDAYCTTDLHNTMVVKAAVDPKLNESYSWTFEGDENRYAGFSRVYEFDEVGDKNVELTALNQYGCEATKSFNILVQETFNIKAPNAFSPNDGDGVNDTWMPLELLNNQYEFVLQVFNRRGQIIYETTNAYQPWDGTINGTVLPKGTPCVWKVDLQKDGKSMSFMGSVLVM